MPMGLSFGIGPFGSDARAAGPVAYGSAPAPATATEAAFGPGSGGPSARGGLSPRTPVGFAFWAGVLGVAFLVGIYRSLPG